MNNVLTLSGISYKVQGKSILHDIDLTLRAQEIVTIVGPNGAGKTTLLSIALGLVSPTQGTVTHHAVNGRPLPIGFVPQLVNRESTMPITVIEFMRLAKHCPPKKEIMQLLQDLSLTKLAPAFLNDLSGGELRRILFARALLNRPHLLVLDEPTAGVDVTGQESFYQQLKELREYYQFAILMVSHDLHLVMSATDRVVCLNRHICCQGKPAQIINDHAYKALFNKDNTQQNIVPPEQTLYRHEHDHSHE